MMLENKRMQNVISDSRCQNNRLISDITALCRFITRLFTARSSYSRLQIREIEREHSSTHNKHILTTTRFRRPSQWDLDPGHEMSTDPDLRNMLLKGESKCKSLIFYTFMFLISYFFLFYYEKNNISHKCVKHFFFQKDIL